MKNSLRGVLLSGLIIPGLGQIALKHRKRGVIILLTVLVSLAVAVVNAMQQALAVMEKMELEGGIIDISSISTAANQAATNSSSLAFDFALLLVVFCWIISVVDAYRIGKKKDLEESSEG